MNKLIKQVALVAAFFVASIGLVSADASTTIQKNHILNFNPAQQAGLTHAPWPQVHAHSTGNVTATMQGERLFMGNNWMNANYTHIVGWNYETGRAESWEIMPKGGAYDMGGIDNWEGWGSVEFAENIPNAAAFKQVYQAYIDTLRQLADEAGVTYDLDDGTNVGIITHDHSSKSGRGSDHTDPLGFLARWGVSYDQFKLDLKTGKAFTGVSNGNNTGSEQKPTPKPSKDTKAIKAFKNAGNQFVVTKTVRVDKIAYVNGQYQMISEKMAGGKNWDWTNNGIPLAMVDNITRGNYKPTKIGDKVKISVPYNYGTIDAYDNASNGVGITMERYGLIWFSGDAMLAL